MTQGFLPPFLLELTLITGLMLKWLCILGNKKPLRREPTESLLAPRQVTEAQSWGWRKALEPTLPDAPVGLQFLVTPSCLQFRAPP